VSRWYFSLILFWPQIHRRSNFCSENRTCDTNLVIKFELTRFCSVEIPSSLEHNNVGDSNCWWEPP
jgi:hypothetical protein